MNNFCFIKFSFELIDEQKIVVTWCKVEEKPTENFWKLRVWVFGKTE